MTAPFIAACVQMNAGSDVAANLEQAGALIRQARTAGAELICTPENTGRIVADRNRAVREAPSEAEHPALPFFAGLAREIGAWILVGSIAVRVSPERCANRSLLYDAAGRLVARYDKIHMFDVKLANGEHYTESERMQPGERAVVAETPWGGLGMTICYDLRFPHLYRDLVKAGADILVVPSAFTRPTGAAHWETLLRARAIESGAYLLAPAQCGLHDGGRGTWGHSLIISPWGEILAAAGEECSVITARLDPAAVASARAMIPALSHDRFYEGPAAAAGGAAKPAAA
ncbi:MAG: carbon-nitrogen hydrolase family protein [Dongiaceae bacterium]